MKTCLGCVVVLLIIACIFVIPWGNINWGNAACGVFSIIAWLCLIGGAILYMSALAEFAQFPDPHPLIAIIAIFAALIRPRGIGGFLLFLLGLVLVGISSSC
jgi:hypothetical protein